MKTKNILRIFCSLIFVWGAMTMTAQVIDNNLLLNPGFELPVATASPPSTGDLGKMDSWKSATALWFDAYYNTTGISIGVMTSNRRSDADAFFTTGNGTTISDVLTGHFTGRLPGSETGGTYQEVIVIPGETYEFGCDFAVKVTNTTTQAIKGTEGIKIISAMPTDSTTVLGTVTIPASAAGTAQIVTHLHGEITIKPEWNVTKVRFQIDQRNTAALPNGPGNAPVICFDQCFFRPVFVIEAGQSRLASEYTSDYGDIIIKSDDANGTGQLTDIPAEGLPVNGVVKFEKAFASGQWYPVGFPFDVNSINVTIAGADYTLKTYNQGGDIGDKGDFWLKTYDGENDQFLYYNNSNGSANIDAGGYVLQVPSGLNNQPITFSSESNITLYSSTAFPAITEASGYQLMSSPSYANFDVQSAYPATTGNNYYTYGTYGDSNFGLNHNLYTVKPFESVVVENNSPLGLRSSLGADGITALPALNLSNDKVVATEYYNLMGVKVARPAKGNIYVIKTVFESGKTSVVKQFIENN